MKTTARIATALTAAFVSLFVAAPAFAHEGEKFNPEAQFSTVNDPIQVGAILICGFIILAVVLLLAQALSAPFGKK